MKPKLDSNKGEESAPEGKPSTPTNIVDFSPTAPSKNLPAVDVPSLPEEFTHSWENDLMNEETPQYTPDTTTPQHHQHHTTDSTTPSRQQ